MNPTKQGVFNAAWIGLKSQEFKKSMGADGCGCVLYALDGKRCARGWAYEAFGEMDVTAAVGEQFEIRLMQCHDPATSPADMEARLRLFAKAEGLTIPEESKPVPSVRERLDAIYAGNVMGPLESEFTKLWATIR